ncbi:MAG: isochorismatase family protein [candidate division WOR-3 bacterium]|nr:MAG: isochorismatase family protein [candidate division WOR-3 bacterium]
MKKKHKKQPVKKMKPALLVIDIQNSYLTMIPEHERRIALEMINGVIWMFREHGYPIIQIYHTDPKFGPKPGTKDFKFPPSVRVKSRDPRIIKNYSNAFKKTDLKKILDKKGRNTLFLCGLSAVGCVLATHFAAKDLDYTSFMVKGALMSHDSQYTKFVEHLFETVGWTALKTMLDLA